MSNKNTISTVTLCAELNGWNVHTEKVTKTRHIIFEFSRFTPAGQNFSFQVAMNGGNLKSLIQEMMEYYEAFDADAEAYLWLDSSGHGRNGAPYRMKDVLADMEAAEQMIKELLQALIESEDRLRKVS